MDETKLQHVLTHPALRSLREAAGDLDAYLVGGSVRDLLLGRPLGDLDVAIDGEIEPILERLGDDARTHERFGTATVTIEGTAVDLARTRRESYAEPGALPEVEPAPIRVDLARRDFTANALALALSDEPQFLDPYDGVADIDARLLRVIHPASFADDPTRALRAARYAARLGFELEQGTEQLLALTDLRTVSDDRVAAELLRIAGEANAVEAFGLLSDWGLLPVDAERLKLMAAAAALVGSAPWEPLVDRAELLTYLARATEEEIGSMRALAELKPGAPSAGFAAANPYPDRDLAVARALGGAWLEDHVSSWRRLELAIDGNDLLVAGIPEGPELGRLLAIVHAGRLDGVIGAGREPELAAALAAAGDS